MKIIINRFVFLGLLVILPIIYSKAQVSQDSVVNQILMRSETHEDKILLRWIAPNAKTWRLLNVHGVRLTRTTIARDGKILSNPEIIVLGDSLRPRESEQLKAMIQEYPMGAVMAQAIFGESFEVSTMDDGISKVLALSQEEEQRYMFSLYAADQCFPVALEMGWGWQDSNIKPDETYLYKVTPLFPVSDIALNPGAEYVVPTELTKFSAPLELSGKFGDSSVMLAWNYETLSFLYPSYLVERSEDGISFSSLSDLPITRMGEVNNTHTPITYMDSIPNDKTFYYRVAGITPFGTIGAYSDTIAGVAYQHLDSSPIISSSIPDNGGGCNFTWLFNEDEEKLLKEFRLLNSPDNKHFVPLKEGIAPYQRSFHLTELSADAPYYIIEALSKREESKRSFSVLVQKPDSIPPAIPSGLIANIDSLGVVQISWDPNKDVDILGYRLFKGNAKGEELVPINDIPISQTFYVDSVDMVTMNTHAYYAITAVDKRYNQSELSAVVEAKKPEVIPPSQPVIKNIEPLEGRNVIIWESGHESTLSGFLLMRYESGSSLPILIKIDDPQNTKYEDKNINPGSRYSYTITSITNNGLRSKPSNQYEVTSYNLVSTKSKDKTDFSLTMDLRGVTLKWSTAIKDILSISIYKKVDSDSYSLLRDSLNTNGEFIDNDIQSLPISYMLVVKKKNGSPIKLIKQALR